MIGLELKSDAKSAVKLPVSSKETPTSSLSFASLLQGIQEIGEEKSLPQNGALILALKKETIDEKALDLKDTKQLSTLQGLLKGDELKEVQEEIESLQLNPKVTQDKSISELKVLIQEAKQYLKDKITSLEGFQKSEIATLPKTLKGLTQVAQKLGLDLSKITLVETKQQEKTEQKTLKQTPLFQAQTKTTELTTQQFVSTKINNSIEKPVKQKSENTLELLLRGDKALKQESSMTSDFSVATARVIAPSAKTESQQNLESLLHGESQGETHLKTDTTQVAKADSFEVKVNEAKQMIKYLSQDVKQAIDDYKAPFTRVKVQLNPQNLGEVDLTVVQRGKNLHINLSSNNAAINTLALNANDLKTQLNNTGIQNASLNFSNMSQGEQGGSGSHTHQQQHNRQNAQEEYGYFQVEETKEEIMSSLEIVVPHYA